MVSIPDISTKTQDAIENSPTTLAEARVIIREQREASEKKEYDYWFVVRAKSEYISRLENFIAQQGLVYHAETAELSTPQTDAGDCGKTDRSTEEANRELSNDSEQLRTADKCLRSNPEYTQTGVPRSQGTPRTLFELAIGLTSILVGMVETLEEDLDTTQDYNKDLCEQLAGQDTVINAHIQEEIYRHTLFANPDLSSSEKLVLLASRGVVRELRADDDTSLTDFHLNTIAQQTGLTNETVGKKLKRLDDVFNTVEYKTEKVFAGKDKDGKRIFVSDTKLALLPLVDQPQMIQLPDGAPRQGGPREKKVCPACGSDKVQRATHTSCLNCKHTLELTVHMVNEECVGLEQSDADALFMLGEAVQDASHSLTGETPSTLSCDTEKCTCAHTSENHHDAIPVVASVEETPHSETQETPDYKPAWRCDCRDAYKGWYWSRKEKVWMCTGCHKFASKTKPEVMV